MMNYHAEYVIADDVAEKRVLFMQSAMNIDKKHICSLLSRACN